MKEIEIKARVTNFEELISQLNTLGCIFSDEEVQTDRVYVQKVGDVTTYLSNTHFVRIRHKSDNSYVFTVKADLSKLPSSQGHLVKKEAETNVSDGQALEDILFMMGYQLSNTVIKRRRKANFNDLEICLDKVDDLGTFIEVERLSDDEPAKILEEISLFLESLGVYSQDQVKKGYDILMLERLFS